MFLMPIWHRKPKVEPPREMTTPAPMVSWPLFPGSTGEIEIALIRLGVAVAKEQARGA